MSKLRNILYDLLDIIAIISLPFMFRLDPYIEEEIRSGYFVVPKKQADEALVREVEEDIKAHLRSIRN